LQEVEIPFATSLKNGEMKDLKVGPNDNDKVLIARFQEKLYSIGNYCTHYGAPLTTGQIYGDKVYCPWHAASFNLQTGALEGAPGLDGVASYKVIERNGKHFV
jgi:apoptosis-inducing factor 3